MMKVTAALAIGVLVGSTSALVPFHTAEKFVPGQYIVVIKGEGNLKEHLIAIQKEFEGEILHEYEIGNFKGYSIKCEEKVIQRIREMEDIVEYIEQDQYASAYASQSNPPSWGLDRIDQRILPLNNLYKYPNSAGSGVNMYTLDTGIRITHKDFSGRATWGYNAVSGSANDDKHGHGTHCSGTMAGTAHGVAKSAKLIAVKVLGDSGSGSYSGIIAGVNWVANRHKQTGGNSVGNMSLGGGASSSLDTAVNSAVSTGVHIAVAAGNDNSNACNFSPARASQSVCVGSTTRSDAKSGFSNHGSCVKIHAPGSDIISAYITSDTATRSMSGTSMASPHVAGVMAIYLSRGKKPTAAALQAASSKGAISGLPSGTVNYLLFSDDLVEKIDQIEIGQLEN